MLEKERKREYYSRANKMAQLAATANELNFISRAHMVGTKNGFLKLYPTYMYVYTYPHIYICTHINVCTHIQNVKEKILSVIIIRPVT